MISPKYHLIKYLTVNYQNWNSLFQYHHCLAQVTLGPLKIPAFLHHPSSTSPSYPVVFVLFYFLSPTTSLLSNLLYNFFLFLLYFALQYCIGFAIHWHESATGVRVPNPEPPSHLPLHIISLDHPRAPAPSILYPVSNIDWRFVSYIIVSMFQCHTTL